MTSSWSKDQPKAVLAVLDTIARSARDALTDAQRVIEGVRDDGMVTPEPRLSGMNALIQGMQRGSLKIQRSESGTPLQLSTGQEVAVFRIVQECLTNALKNGGRGADVRIHFDWSGPGLTLHAASTGSGDPEKARNPARGRAGRGLSGMRERAHLTGGWLTAEPNGEHFRVTVFIPYGTRDASSGDDAAGAEARSCPNQSDGAEAQPALTAIGTTASKVSEPEMDDRG